MALTFLTLFLTQRSHYSESLAGLAVSCGFGALWPCSGIWSVALTVVIWTFGEMLLLPAAAAYISDLAPPGRSGGYVGINSAIRWRYSPCSQGKTGR